MEIIDQIEKSEVIKLIETTTQNTPIIIDFDETLFLRNSTAEYIDSLRPRVVGILLLKVLYLFKPWNRLPKSFRNPKVEDWFLVIVPTILLPWTWFLWQKQAKQLAKKYKNQELLAAVNHNFSSPIVVATVGFNFIINPILNYLPLKCDRVVGCRFWQGFKDRTDGKLLMLERVLSQQEIESAIAITDSSDDLPLLRKVAKPCLVVWPLAQYIVPLQNVYLPFLYLEKVKRFGQKYLAKVIMWEDLPLLWLAYSWQARNPILHGISIFLLLVSFWCVYEIGYYENDLVAEKYEEKPNLSTRYQTYKNIMNSWSPWVWALGLAVLGNVCLSQAEGLRFQFDNQLSAFNPIWLHLTGWIVFLLATRLCFWIFNYLNKNTRTWLYLLLQFCRYYGFLAVTSTNIIGTSLLSSHVISHTVLYIVYRYGGGSANNWPEKVPRQMLRWIMFIFILSAIAIGEQDLSLWFKSQTWVIIIWCMLQARGQVVRFVSQIRTVAKDGSNQVT